MPYVYLAWQRPSFSTGGRKKWSRAGASRPDSRPGEQEVLLCIRWTGCVCVCMGEGRAAGGRWTLVQLAGGSGPLAGGCTENRN